MTLLAAWNFEEASGNVLDHSGNGRTITLTGNTARTAAGSGYTYGGTVSGSKGLTQSAADIQLASITGLNTTSRTVEFWGKLPGGNPSWAMEYYRSNDDTGVWGWLMLSGVFRFRAKNSSNTVFERTLTQDASNWHHYAATHDGTSLKVYVDGTQVGATISMAFAVWTATDIRVFDNTGSAAFIDDVRIYDTVLDAAAITTDMNTPVTAPATPFSGWGVPLG